MTKDEEIRMINEKLDFYVMEASDEEFDTEEVRKFVTGQQRQHTGFLVEFCFRHSSSSCSWFCFSSRMRLAFRML